MIREGDIFYTKVARSSLSENFVECGVKGHVFGIALGTVRGDQPEPKKSDVRLLLGAIGLFELEDIEAVFGMDAPSRIIKYVADSVERTPEVLT